VTRALLRRADPVLAAILLLGAFLCLGGLGGRGLWQDEAETAMLARRVLERGVPLADDDFNAVSAELGRDRDERGLWNWSPWLPIYAAAASMRVLGENEAAARLPFALAGFLCLPAVFLLSRRWLESLWAARFSALALALSTPFLLHARQARWYSLAALACAALLLCLDGLLAGRRRPSAGFVAAGLALFYANYFVAIGLLAAVAVSAFFFHPRPAERRRLALALLAVALGAVPGLAYFHVLERPGGFEPSRFAAQGLRDLVLAFAFVLPWPAALAAPRTPRARFLLALGALYLLYLALAPWLFLRYVIVLAPAAAVLTGAALDRLRRYSRALAVAAVVLLASDLPALGLARWADAGPLRSPLVQLAREIGGGYESCDRAAARYIKERAAPDDVVLTNYGDSALQFYSGLRVRGGDQGPPWPESPEWAAMHPYELSRDPGRDYDVLRFFRARAARGGYRVEPFACPDPVLADAPEPETHLFARPGGGKSLVILRRTRG